MEIITSVILSETDRTMKWPLYQNNMILCNVICVCAVYHTSDPHYIINCTEQYLIQRGSAN